MPRWKPPTPEEENAFYQRIDEGVSEHCLTFSRPRALEERLETSVVLRRSSRTSLSGCCRSEAFAHGGVTRGRWGGDLNISRRPLETPSSAVAALRQFCLCLLLSWDRSTARRGIGSAAFPAQPS